MIKYRYTSGAKPAIAALTLAVGTGLSWAALKADEAPILIVIILWAIVGVLVLVFLGALISTSVEVDDIGIFTMSKTLGGLPMANIRLRAGAIKAVELNCAMTPGFERANDTGGSSPDKPRYRLDVIHENGKCHIEASANYDSISTCAKRLAAALNCPLQKTGDWIN